LTLEEDTVIVTPWHPSDITINTSSAYIVVSLVCVKTA